MEHWTERKKLILRYNVTPKSCERMEESFYECVARHTGVTLKNLELPIF